MYISPQLLYFAVWLIPLMAPFAFSANYIQQASDDTYLLVLTTIVLFFVAGYIFQCLYQRPKAKLKDVILQQIDIGRLENMLYKMFKLWLVIYMLTILYSGGIPIYWMLSGEPKSYVDFGIPTVSGFEHLIRAFILACIALIYFCQPEKFCSHLKIVAVVLIASAFVLETGRGNGVVMLLHPMAYFFMFVRVGFRQLSFGTISLFAFLLVLGAIQVARLGAAADINLLFDYAANQGFASTDVGIVEALLIPSLMYMAVPLVNLDLNVSVVPLLSFDPYNSIQSLMPTIVRGSIFGEGKDYGLLINESHNVSSFFIPFLRDFGLLGAYLCASVCIVWSAYVYAKARQGKLFWLLIWPSLFMSVILSFFSLFFTSLVVVLYPIVAKYVYDRVRIRG